MSPAGCLAAWKKRPESKRLKADRALAAEVTAVHQQSRGRYGSPRVHAELRARGRRVSRKRVARLMEQQGLAARGKRRFVRTTDSRHGQPVAPNLLARDFSPGQPNCTWATDITYVWTRQGWLYLAVVLDFFWLYEAFSAACPVRATAGTTRWRRASSAA